MEEPQREDLLSDHDRKQVRALGAARSHDRAASCTQQVLIKVIDKLGMMTTAHTEQGLVCSAPVLEAHYECQDCRRVMLQTANPEALEAYNTHLVMTEKFFAVAQAIDGVKQALSNRRREQ